MERVLCLFFLLFSLSGAELQNNDNQVSHESVNLLKKPHLLHSDNLHAIFRNLSLAVTEQRLRIELLETINREQTAKLRVLEQQTSEVQTVQQAQAAELRSITTRTDEAEKHVESLRRDGKVRRVAFSASLLASGSGNIGPLDSHTTLVFKYIFSNIGNAYNPSTGFFTAPVRGAYHFLFHAGAIGHPSYGSIVSLVKNGNHLCNAYEWQSNGFGTSANGATLLLEAGDVVSLRLWAFTVIHDSENHHSTFTGFLLFPLCQNQSECAQEESVTR